jgi:hypothetical protein
MKRLEVGVQAFDVRRVLQMVDGRRFECNVPLFELGALCDEALMFSTKHVRPIADHALMVTLAIISRICDFFREASP